MTAPTIQPELVNKAIGSLLDILADPATSERQWRRAADLLASIGLTPAVMIKALETLSAPASSPPGPACKS